MSGNLVEERSAAESLADVIDALCAKRAEWQQRAEWAEARDTESHDELNRLRIELARTRGERDDARNERAKLWHTVQQQNERSQRGQQNLERLDKITLDLWLYLMELAGHRDTAKTKAERIALGHVVERLKAIRGVNDAEAEALG